MERMRHLLWRLHDLCGPGVANSPSTRPESTLGLPEWIRVVIPTYLGPLPTFRYEAGTDRQVRSDGCVLLKPPERPAKGRCELTASEIEVIHRQRTEPA